MSSRLTVCLLLLLPGVLLSQFDRSVEFTGGIDRTYRHLSASDDGLTLGRIISNRNDAEEGKYNWHVGLHYNHRLGRQFFLKTGLQLASMGYRDKPRTDLRWSSEYSGDGEWTKDPTLPHELEVRRDYWFVAVPLVARYELLAGRLSPYVELGLAPSLYLSSRTRVITDLDDETEVARKSSPRIRDVQLVGLFGVGVSYALGDGIQLFVQPSLRYHLTAMTDVQVEERFYGWGMRVGVRRGF